jgi:hypothetical protein
MASVRCVIHVPMVFETELDTVTDKKITEFARAMARQQVKIESLHPRASVDEYSAIILEAVVVEDDGPMVELVAPNVA